MQTGEIMPDIVIGARQIKNPKGIKPALDTDRPAPSPNKFIKMNAGNYYKGDSGMNTSNPSKTNIEPAPKQHPLDDLTMRGIKRSNGNSIPRSDVTISDN
jgi:hypothetical protein